MKRISLTVALVIVLSGQTFGKEQPGPNRKHVEFFDAYVGTWSRTGPLEEDLPFGKKDDVGTASITWKWAYNRNVIDWQWKFDFAGKRSGTKGTFTWDPSENRLVGAGVFSDGGVIRVTARSTDPLTLECKFVEADGEIRSHVETFTLSDDDAMTIRVTERKGGSLTADGPEYIFKRVHRSRKPKGT
jgi:hypothetical protein